MVAWKGQAYQLQVVRASEQIKQFLWQDLNVIASNMQTAWCVLGDFNAVLSPNDRIGGEEVQLMEIKNFAECLEDYELAELRTTGAYSTWTNETIWSRLGKVLANCFWYWDMDILMQYALQKGSQIIHPCRSHFPLVQRESQHLCFVKCDFKRIIQRHCQTELQGFQTQKVYEILRRIRGSLKKLNRDKFADLHKRQGIARRALEMVQEQLH
ncbi:hypothetical protein Cgig2_020719 [Carnegiea gigantea]|uniref:Endonuclease/exonuclease/phosphatase domain-containing protein n=1 Tax=Carnegiea gigantea TaxID=171969 RepID=A0A9Q1GHK6_9CARY|nr:hypothetical protein Cgig2_020719 [Carnegiea gigantea]